MKYDRAFVKESMLSSTTAASVLLTSVCVGTAMGWE
jgi:hypothetical protein